MKSKNLIVIAVVVVFGIGMWGVGWVVANPTQPWPSLDAGGSPDGELSALAKLAVFERAG